MAKKVRKPRADNPRTYAQTNVSQSQPAVPAPAKAAGTVSAASAAPVAGKDVDLASEYRIVGRDLRSLLLTAAVMFGVLIAINVVINLVS